MQRARVFWTHRASATVAAITTTSGAAWRWRITDDNGTGLEESDELFPTITAALAAGRRRLTAREGRDAARLYTECPGSALQPLH